MDAKIEKRIDSLYRNISSFTTLTILSVIVPILLIFVVPLSLAYLYLRAKLLAEIDTGRIRLDSVMSDNSARTAGMTTVQKVDFIRQNSGRLWMPSIVLVGVVVVVTVLLAAMNA
jgi:hypothetical protein